MPKKAERERSGLSKLALYSLITNGRKLMISSESREEVESAKKELKKNLPDLVLVIEDFGAVPIGSLTPKGYYSDFVKVPGYSLWRQIK